VHQPSFQVSFRPNTKLVSTVRRFTEELYDLTMHHDISGKVAIATHELLENAVTYASDGLAGVRIEVTDGKLVVRTWNRTSPSHLAAVMAKIDEMNQVADADAYYQLMLNKTAYRTDGSGLGLARIRAEAEMSITYEVVNEHLHIKAIAPLTPPVMQ